MIDINAFENLPAGYGKRVIKIMQTMTETELEFLNKLEENWDFFISEKGIGAFIMIQGLLDEISDMKLDGLQILFSEEMIKEEKAAAASADDEKS